MDESERPPTVPVAPRRPADALRRSAPASWWGEWGAVFSNRFVLGGLGVVLVLLLISIVLVVVGGGDDTESSSTAVSTPDGEARAEVDVGLSGTTTRTTAMRNGPGFQHPILGTIPRNVVVAVVGRNGDATWVQVVYPPSSGLRGWVQDSSVDVSGNVMRLAVSSPGRAPSVELPPGGVLVEEPGFPIVTPEPIIPIEEPTPILEPTEELLPTDVPPPAPTEPPLPTEPPPTVPPLPTDPPPLPTDEPALE